MNENFFTQEAAWTFTMDVDDDYTTQERYWIFTFGCGQQHAGHYVKFYGTYTSAREQMLEKYGTEWCFQYSEDEWNTMLNNPNRRFPMETELKEDN